ncbi:MAG: DUF1080 domain-containing protein [Bryobacterales bacterium]|nr:DUF1080 domain-containing protein [Bryobacterales bacterium]
MATSQMTRRTFTSLVAGSAVAAGEWVDLFDGKSLDGWRAAENPGSWKVADGSLYAGGPRSHLFYTGGAGKGGFKNFELEVEAKAAPLANSGVYFHSAYQEKGWPDQGFEIQINNTATGEGGYRERKKTGSLYAIRNVYKQMVGDNEWFTLAAAVRGNNIQVRLNGTLIVDYVEPATPFVPRNSSIKERRLGRGTFALQCHDAGSKAWFRRVRVRPLADGIAAVGEAPATDDTYRDIMQFGADNIPMVDFHVHLKGGLTLEQALARSRRDGIQYGIAINVGMGFPVQDDAGLASFIHSMKGQPAFVAMQAEGREWVEMVSRKTAAQFDYIFTDSMTWTDRRGKRMRTWLPGEVGEVANPQEFVDTLVERAVGILEREPVDIYVNPTYLPDVLSKDYDRLWTEERMKKVAAAAARNNVAVELNDRYKIPSPAFVRVFKDAGCKFAFGTNNTGPADLGRSEYGLRMIKECGLRWQDFWVPGLTGKAIDRKGSILKL